MFRRALTQVDSARRNLGQLNARSELVIVGIAVRAFSLRVALPQRAEHRCGQATDYATPESKYRHAENTREHCRHPGAASMAVTVIMQNLDDGRAQRRRQTRSPNATACAHDLACP
jgi:hypothetical protein